MTKSTQLQKPILFYSWDISVIIPCWIWLFISFKSACSFGFPGTVVQGFLILPLASFGLPSPHTPVHGTPQWFLQMLDLCPSSAFIPTGSGSHNSFPSSYRHSPLYPPIYSTVLFWWTNLQPFTPCKVEMSFGMYTENFSRCYKDTMLNCYKTCV